ncbi:MAG: YfhO family protein [Cyanobacteriota bacterium]
MHYPLKVLAFNLIKMSEFPFWNPYILCGFPLFASLQVGVLYPQNILFLILNPGLAFSLNIILTYIIASIGMFLYCKELNKNVYASFFAAIVFTFSSFLMFKMENIPLIQEVSLIPFILLFLERSKISIINVNTLFVALLLSIQFFAGHPQVGFLTILLILIIQTYNTINNFNTDQKFLYILSTLIIFSLSVLLSSIQLLPTLELTLNSLRTGLTYQEYTFGSFPPAGLFSLIFPFIAGGSYYNGLYTSGIFNQFDSIGNFCCYTGILPLLFFFFAIITVKNNNIIRMWLLIAIIGLILSFGSYFPLHLILYKIPGINFFRYPARYILLFNIAICVISSFGIIEITKIAKDKFKKYIIISIISFIAIIICGIVFVLKVNTTNVIDEIPIFSANILIPVLIVIISLASLAYYYYKNSDISKRTVIAVLIVDLVIFFGFFTGWRTEYKMQSTCVMKPPEVAAYLEKNLGFAERFITLHKEKAEFHGEFNLVEPDYSMLFKIYSLNGYEVLNLKRYQLLLNTLIVDNKPCLKFSFDSPFVDLLGCKFFVTRDKTSKFYLNNEKFIYNWKQAFKYGQIRVFENKKCLPKAFIVNDFIVFDNVNKINRYIRSLNDWNPATTALIEKEYVNKIKLKPSKQKYKSKVKVSKYSPNKIIIEVNNTHKGILILNDTYYNFWNADIDNKKTQIIPVNLSMRGVIVPEGNHKITFFINDTIFNIGSIISAISFTGLLIAIMLMNKTTKSFK